MHTVTTRKYHVYSLNPDRKVLVSAVNMDDAQDLAIHAWESMDLDHGAIVVRKAPNTTGAEYAVSWADFGMDEN